MIGIEELLFFLFGSVLVILVLAALVVTPLLALWAFQRTRRISQLERRLEALEAQLARQRPLGAEPPASAVAPGAAEPATPIRAAPAESDNITEAVVVVDEPAVVPAAAASAAPPCPPARPAAAPASFPGVPVTADDSIALEMLIGRQALGWIAVVVLLFATGFFLRYAFENQWIGPIGRVSLGIMGGLTLVGAGWRQERRGWRVFSRMLTSGGIVLLYLSTFAAFGFYHLVPQTAAATFLVLLVAEAALLALAYDSAAIAVMALIGGLLTPLLLSSDHDQYVSLFTYLVVLTLGSLGLLTVRSWSAVGTLSLLGVYGLFWGWYAGNYHPEKFVAATVFLAVIGVAHGSQIVWSAAARPQGASWENLFRTAFNAGLTFTSLLVLLDDRHAHWQGALALLFAAVFAGQTRWQLTRCDRSQPLLLLTFALATGFIALAFPLQASRSWIALGWATQAAVLWWFGGRVSVPPMRWLGAALAALAIGRLALVDIPELGFGIRDYVYPVANLDALPALLAIALLLGTLVFTRRRDVRGPLEEQIVSGIGVVACLLLVWYLVSVDLFRWFRPQHPADWSTDWSRQASMWLSTWWGIYATLLLAIGFATRAGLLRWTALALYALTLGKVFLVDMAGLDQIYRIVAFFALAVFLGLAAWAYQYFGTSRARVSPESPR